MFMNVMLFISCSCNWFFAIAIVLEQPSNVVIFAFLFPKERAEVANPKDVPISKIVFGWK